MHKNMKMKTNLIALLLASAAALAFAACGSGSFDVPPMGTDITPDSGLVYDEAEHGYLLPLSDDRPEIRYRNFVLTKPEGIDFIAKALNNSDMFAEWELRAPPPNAEFYGRVQYLALNPPRRTLEELKEFCEDKFREDKRIVSYSSEITEYDGTSILLMEGVSRETNSGRIIKLNGFIMLDPDRSGSFFNVSATRIAYENKIDLPALQDAAEAFLHAFRIR